MEKKKCEATRFAKAEREVVENHGHGTQNAKKESLDEAVQRRASRICVRIDQEIERSRS
jgi:hypothetical protein